MKCSKFFLFRIVLLLIVDIILKVRKFLLHPFGNQLQKIQSRMRHAYHIGKKCIHIVKLAECKFKLLSVWLVKTAFTALLNQTLAHQKPRLAFFHRNLMDGGILALIVIIQRLLHAFKMRKMQQPDWRGAVVLVKVFSGKRRWWASMTARR